MHCFLTHEWLHFTTIHFSAISRVLFDEKPENAVSWNVWNVVAVVNILQFSFKLHALFLRICCLFELKEHFGLRLEFSRIFNDFLFVSFLQTVTYLKFYLFIYNSYNTVLMFFHFINSFHNFSIKSQIKAQKW